MKAPSSTRIWDVIDRLEIGPVRLEKNRLAAPYKVIQDGKTSTFDLIYRYQENVFIPHEPQSINLAQVIAAQVAVNYGLFCREIIFHGSMDEIDQKFVMDMMENTAREIFVKKFLQPNPFLVGEAVRTAPVKRPSYLRAKVVFSDKGHKSKRVHTLSPTIIPWQTNPSLYAVLSSGGKDSLLSFGLLKEIAGEVHPVFINESGRHWFTALNGYRYFSAHYPQTARVWINADRLFSWMLRHFPFIRQDFTRIRSDEYPIRLWTVAVFLLGALPILRKRGIGRLVIGDEFDTTSKLSYKGITHYDGLYDQSRYFDNALTRYYTHKKWNIHQFSILRPLSEMLIEKILVKRYSHLQRNQVSCHATHVMGNRVYPCGKCEKCRRIVGMLVALGTDPSRCGYTETQVKDCLKAIAEKGVHQEKAGAQHLISLLMEKGLIPGTSKGRKVRRQEEIMKIRFDPEKFPVASIPVDLREPLLKIFFQYADGAVKRQGRIWIEYDPLEDPALRTPYPFEMPGYKFKDKEELEGDVSKQKGRDYLLEELTWPEAQIRFKEVDLALLPVGSIEQHGPHLPLDTDAFDALHLAREVASSCSDPKPIVLPLIPYGVSYHHLDFSGTLSVKPKTLSQLVYDIGMSVARHGITKLVIINAHGGNIPALQFASQMINRDARIFTCVETGETSEKDVLELIETINDVHAGETETSTTLAVRPSVVRKEKIKKYIPRFSSRYLDFSSKRSVEWYARVARISPSGVLGDPTKASAEKGEKIWTLMIEHLVRFVEDLKRMSLEEIFHKRY